MSQALYCQWRHDAPSNPSGHRPHRGNARPEPSQIHGLGPGTTALASGTGTAPQHDDKGGPSLIQSTFTRPTGRPVIVCERVEGRLTLLPSPASVCTLECQPVHSTSVTPPYHCKLPVILDRMTSVRPGCSYTRVRSGRGLVRYGAVSLHLRDSPLRV